MALTKCGECGGEVSTQAKACPKCGAPPPKQKAPGVPGWLSLVIVVGLVAFFASMFKSAGSGMPATPSQPPAQAAPTRGPGGVTIPSDPSGVFYVLEVSGPKSARAITTKRVGKGGELTFSKRLFDCGRAQVKYLGSGETQAAMAASKPDPRMSEVVPGSIADHIGGIACK